MMKNVLEYKGYYTKINFSVEDKVLFGKIEGINDLVNFESESIDEIENEFHVAVDDYLEFCESVGKSPDKVYKGTFNVRISPALHREAAMLALKRNESLNKVVEDAIEIYVKGTTRTEVTLRETVTTLSKALLTKATCDSASGAVKINAESIGRFSKYGNINMQYLQ
jgi:hicB|nr:MAG TPA: putative nuclease [Caudoviricetes sp.]